MSLTPLIDVVFLLLIFFVMAGRFADEARLVIKSPSPSPAAEIPSEAPPAMMLVQVDADGGLTLLGSTVNAEELAARQPDNTSVVLRLAPEMPLEIMVGVIDGLNAAGVDGLSYWPESER